MTTTTETDHSRVYEILTAFDKLCNEQHTDTHNKNQNNNSEPLVYNSSTITIFKSYYKTLSNSGKPTLSIFIQYAFNK